MNILVTGGAGFIGSCFIDQELKKGHSILNIDKLTYAGNLDNLAHIRSDRYRFVRSDIGESKTVSSILDSFKPDAVVNFAAETHVDRSIYGPSIFFETNVVGTCKLLEAVTKWWDKLPSIQQNLFRFMHISTDEVYGSLDRDDTSSTEDSPIAPNSPYSASKASSDLLVRSYNKTYGLPTLISRCTNNYGPRQFPEKLIPLTIMNAVSLKELPVYGDGSNIRDWIYVEDHCRAVSAILEKAAPGEVFNVSADSEKSNLEVVKEIARILDEVKPRQDGNSYSEQITFVTDRPGHDFRYSLNSSKLRNLTGWSPSFNFEKAFKQTVLWYLSNDRWCKNVKTPNLSKWLDLNYSNRHLSSEENGN